MTRVRDIPVESFRNLSDLLGPADVAAAIILHTLMDAKSAGIFWKDRESRILGCNQKFADDSGVKSPADLVGKTNFDTYPRAQAEAYRADDLEVINTGVPKIAIEESLLLATGETAWVETNKAPLRNSVGEIIGLLGSYRDVTERHNAGNERMRMALQLAEARQAARMSTLDALTGLPNRRWLQEELNQRMASLGADPKKQFAVIAADLDRFKAINDLHGHAIGDELLKEVARRLSEEAQVEGFVARLGGMNSSW
jgi:PAS domain S-box-containing protein